MKLLLDILGLFTIISFSNLIGIHPNIENSQTWIKSQGPIIKSITYSYVAIVTIGWLNFIVWFIYLYFAFIIK